MSFSRVEQPAPVGVVPRVRKLAERVGRLPEIAVAERDDRGARVTDRVEIVPAAPADADHGEPDRVPTRLRGCRAQPCPPTSAAPLPASRAARDRNVRRLMDEADDARRVDIDVAPERCWLATGYRLRATGPSGFSLRFDDHVLCALLSRSRLVPDS